MPKTWLAGGNSVDLINGKVFTYMRIRISNFKIHVKLIMIKCNWICVWSRIAIIANVSPICIFAFLHGITACLIICIQPMHIQRHCHFYALYKPKPSGVLITDASLQLTAVTRMVYLEAWGILISWFWQHRILILQDKNDEDSLMMKKTSEALSIYRTPIDVLRNIVWFKNVHIWENCT